MLCNRCGYNNKPESKFCIKCGQKLASEKAANYATGNSMGVGSLLQGRYKIIKQIGKGGMGVVYLASDNRFSSRICVVKEMLEHLMNDSTEEKQKALIRFNQEADLLAEINNANVPQVYDRFSEGRRHYLVMEFVAGMNLKDLLEEYMKLYGSPLPEEAVLIFFMQLCLTLKYLHSHDPQILHRDIKPPNILITKEGKVKLVDFGIAKTVQNQAKGTSIGTQGYAPPEQYKGLADERTDIYALGATIHHLLTGRDPQLQAPFDFPPLEELTENISKELSQIIQWMLEMKPENRPRTIDAAINALKSSYKDLEQRLSNYTIIDSKILDIVKQQLSVNSEVLIKNICSCCSYQNKPNSKFCIKCGTPLGNSGKISGSMEKY